jgi:hypothetical protein
MEDEINTREIRQILFNVFRFRFPEHALLNKAIDSCVPRDMSGCSYRGYLAFTHADFKQKVIHEYEHLCYQQRYIRESLKRQRQEADDIVNKK